MLQFLSYDVLLISRSGLILDIGARSLHNPEEDITSGNPEIYIVGSVLIVAFC